MSNRGHSINRVVCVVISDGEETFVERSVSKLLENTDPSTQIVICCNGVGGDTIRGLLPESQSETRRVEVAPWDPPRSDPFYEALASIRERYVGADVAYIQCGLDVPYAWDDRLAFAAHDKSVGTVSPLCDVSPLFQLVYESVSRGVNDVDSLLVSCAGLTSVQVPTFLASCVFISRCALDAVWSHACDSAATLGRFTHALNESIRRAGYLHVLCDHVYVRKHTDDAVQRELEKKRSPDVDMLNRRHPLTGLRHCVNDALRQNRAGSAVLRPPTQLHIVHGWGGGLEKWVREFCDADAHTRNLVLRSSGTWGEFGQRLDLFDAAAVNEPIASWELQYPIRSIANCNLHYRRIVTALAQSHGVEAIIVSSLIGHSLDVLEVCASTIVVMHDYLPFCAAINNFFEEVCEYCDAERLARCFSQNPHNRYFTHDNPDKWLATRERFIQMVVEKDIRIVVPSESVKKHWKQLVPCLTSKVFHIIPHGFTTPRRIAEQGSRENHGRLRVLVLGSLAHNKGGQLLKAVLPEMYAAMEIYLVGCGKEGDFFAGTPGVHVIPVFDSANLSDLVCDINPDIGVLASIVPETFSYTLSELMGFLIPPVVPNRGSFSDRIVDYDTGFMYEPNKDALIAKLQELDGERSKIDYVRAQLGCLADWTEADMVAAYHRLLALPFFDRRRYEKRKDTAQGAFRAGTKVPSLDPDVRFADLCHELSTYLGKKIQLSPRFSNRQKRVLLKAWSLVFGGSHDTR